MICDICGQEGARIRKITETYGKGDNLIVIENIPIVRCTRCGESYFTAETLHEIERIRMHHKTFTVERMVEVAHFA
jgi:YgiT-type zinc finger domain-containing protein